MTRTFTIEKGQKLTEEQIQEVMEAKKETQSVRETGRYGFG